MKSLPFHLLVAGELEIIMDENVRPKERNTRLAVLRKLACMSDFLSKEEIVAQYINFIQKIEKGKFKWGSKSDFRAFEQQLLYSLSLETRRNKEVKSNKKSKFEERKKYCLDYNRGTCRMESSHEGKINGQSVFKLHVCKRCLVNNGQECNHPEKDCKHVEK